MGNLAEDPDSFSGTLEELVAFLTKQVQLGYVGGNASALSRLSHLTQYIGDSAISGSGGRGGTSHTPKDLLIVELKADLELALSRGDLDEALTIAEGLIRRLRI